jgi:DMSO reductase anchor subunit
VLEPWLGAGAAAIGALAVYCSAMIYADTRRPLWRLSRTGPLFAGSAIALGLGAACVADDGGMAALALAWAALNVAKLRFESRLAAHRDTPEWTALKKSALLVAGPLLAVARARVVLGWAFGVALPIAVALTGSTTLAATALAGHALAEWLERQLFFRAQAAPAMPGV